jgi:hypothetical protein
MVGLIVAGILSVCSRPDRSTSDTYLGDVEPQSRPNDGNVLELHGQPVAARSRLVACSECACVVIEGSGQRRHDRWHLALPPSGMHQSSNHRPGNVAWVDDVSEPRVDDRNVRANVHNPDQMRRLIVRDYCVAISAAVPLLLLVVAVESELLARLKSIARRAYANDSWVSAEADRAIFLVSGFWETVLRISVVSSMFTTLGCLLSIPFVSDGKPRGWEWVVLAVPIPTLMLLVLLAGYSLIGKANRELGPPIPGEYT